MELATTSSARQLALAKEDAYEEVEAPLSTDTSETQRRNPTSSHVQQTDRLAPVEGQSLWQLMSSTFVGPDEEEDGKFAWHAGQWSTALASGIVLSLVAMTMNVSLAAVVFNSLPQYTMLGFDANNLSCFLGCLVIACFAQCPLYVCAPNSVGIVVFAGVMQTLVVKLADKPHCIVPTGVMCISTCTLFVGGVFAALGHNRLTKLVQVFPQSVMYGFLGAVGASLMKNSLGVGSGMKMSHIWMFSPAIGSLEFWTLFWPVPILAIALFLMQRKNALPPLVLWSVFLFMPLVIFYTVLAQRGWTVAEMQKAGWFLPDMEATEFYQLWQFGAQLENVHWPAVWEAFCRVLPLVPVIIVDVLVGAAATRKAGGFLPVFDDDAVLTGKLFGLQAFLCCPLATNSTKLSLLNYAIAGAKTRVPTLICCLSNLVLFIAPPVVVPLFPRFYLAFLLQFNALGFLVKNLFDSRHHLSKAEFMVPWVMVIADVEFGLVGSVLSGCMVATGIFAWQYSQLDTVKALVVGTSTRFLVATHKRTPSEDALLRYQSQKIAVVQLQHFLFFGCALQIEGMVNEVLSTTPGRADSVGVRYLIVDFASVDGLDATLVGVFAVAVRKFKEANLLVLFTGMADVAVASKLKREGVLSLVDKAFPTLHDGIGHIEDRILRRSVEIRRAWQILEGHDIAKIQQLSKLQYNEHVLMFMLGGVASDVCSRTRRRSVAAGEKLSTAGQPCTSFFVVQHGLLRQVSAEGQETATLHTGAVFNEFALVLRDETVATCTVRALVPSVVLELTHDAVTELEQNCSSALQQLEHFVLQEALNVVPISEVGFHRQTSATSSPPSPSRVLTPSRGRLVSASHTRMTKCWAALDAESNVKPPTEEQVRKCFARALPHQGSGELPVKDAIGALVALGCDTSRTNVKGNASLPLEEFISLAQSLPTAALPLESAFRASALHGEITPASLREAFPNLSEAQARHLVADADLDDSGGLSWREFVEAVRFVDGGGGK